MVRRIETNPPEFAEWPRTMDWYELVDDKKGDVVAVAGLDWDTIPQSVGLHLEVRVWKPRTIRAFEQALEWLKVEAKGRGLMAIVGHSTNPDADKFFKFAEIFGFGGHMKLAVTRMFI